MPKEVLIKLKVFSTVKGHASVVQNTICLKVYSEGHIMIQLGSLAESAQSRQNRPSFLDGGFYGLHSKILNKMYAEPQMNAVLPTKISLKVLLILFYSPHGML